LRTIGAFVFLIALWLLLSGIYKPMIIGFGAASVLVALLVVRRMDGVDEDRVDQQLDAVASIKYFFWLMAEIAKADTELSKHEVRLLARVIDMLDLKPADVVTPEN